MPPKQAGRMWLMAMGLMLIASGSFFAWRLWISYQMTSVSRLWPSVVCHIESSRIVSMRPTPSSPMAYRFEIRYRYQFAGVSHVSTRIRHVESSPTPHREVVLALQQKFPTGAQLRCYVNPSEPSESVLIPGTRAALYSIWFPLLFVVGGGGMLLGLARQKQSQ